MMGREMMLDYLAGALSGSAGVLFGHPLDTVKCQLQVQLAGNQYRSLRDCCLTIHKQGLARGFFRGLSWPLFSYGLVNSVFFGTYASTLKVLGSHTGHSKAPEFLPILVAGSVGGVAQLSVSVPIEVIKVVLQSQIPHPDKQHKVSGINRDYYKGPREGALDIIRSQGVRGMYRGTITQMYRDVPASASYFLVFEYCSYYSHKHLSFLNSQLIDFVSGGLAGVLSWTLITPLDVLKSRVQADVKGNMYSGLWDCAGKSIKQEGIRVLFRGYSAVATRAFLVNSVTLLVYVELLKAFKVNESIM
ncbi:solute carrier family 25 member 45-like isoform X2 [Mya arenaria]|nr:solute carrier family 25 member 45-like isoform X2 [Mya arenaria]